MLLKKSMDINLGNSFNFIFVKICPMKANHFKGWGTKLMHEAENIGRKHGVCFVTVNTMDWEALSFYQKLGYYVEFVRDGYDKNSKMFFLRKNFFEK